MMKKTIFLLILLTFGFSQTGLYGLDGWYQASTIATAGAPGAHPNPGSDIINPAGFARLNKQAHLSLVKYPVGISAQSLLYIMPIKNANLGFALRHLGYGDFTASDESGIENGDYSASDTWLSATWARYNQNISWGATGGMFLSSLESYNAIAVVFSAGAMYNFTKQNAQVGLSVSNYGFYLKRYTDYQEKLPTKIILSANKELAHLPLNLNFDLGYAINSNDILWRFGGVFALPYNLELLLGFNSNNINQRTEHRSVKSLFGSSGIGLSYTHKQYSIQTGGYSYGSGGWIYGTGFSIEL